ncbi:MAG: gliding motility-associated C-terminal domain-containing protein, partial [Mucilaginibacter sp.]
NENIKSLKFYIYSQWGELLFMSQSQQNGWDGTFKGKAEPAGVYVYYVELVLTNGEQVNKKGTITLLR